MSNTHLRLLGLAALAVLAGCSGARGPDVLIQRDNRDLRGALQSCTADVCTLDRKSIARSSIAWIGLHKQPPPPQAQNAVSDELHLSDGSVQLGKLIAVDATNAVMDKGVYSRDRVDWIHLGRSEAGEEHRDRWYGSLDWSAHQMVPSGPQDWNGHADLALDEDGKGGLTGTLVGNQTQKLGLAKCHAVTNGTVNAALTGTISAHKIAINVASQQSTWPSETPCAEGLSAGTGGVVFQWPQFNEALRGLAPSGDGGYRYDHEFPIPSGTARFTLTLRPAGR